MYIYYYCLLIHDYTVISNHPYVYIYTYLMDLQITAWFKRADKSHVLIQQDLKNNEIPYLWKTETYKI